MSERTKQRKAPHKQVNVAVSPDDYRAILEKTGADNGARAIWEIIDFWAEHAFDEPLDLDGYLGIPYDIIAPAFAATPEDRRAAFLQDWCDELSQPPLHSNIRPGDLEAACRRWLRKNG